MPGMSGSTPRKPTTPNRPAVTPQPKRKKTHTCAPLSLSLSLSNSAKPTRKKKKKVSSVCTLQSLETSSGILCPTFDAHNFNYGNLLVKRHTGERINSFCCFFFVFFVSSVFTPGRRGEWGGGEARRGGVHWEGHKNPRSQK